MSDECPRCSNKDLEQISKIGTKDIGNLKIDVYLCGFCLLVYCEAQEESYFGKVGEVSE